MRWSRASRHITASVLLSIFAVAAHAAPSDMVRWDWYFRESLNAISDWEDILAAWEADTPEEERVPVLPVPSDGAEQLWTNPIPNRLIPPEDRGQTVLAKLDEAGEIVTGYHHPGGGGHDHWYHGWTRRFDGMLRFRAKPAPFAWSIDDTSGLGAGENSIRLHLRSVVDTDIEVTAGLRMLTPDGSADPIVRRATVKPGTSEALELLATLTDPGGAVLLLEIECQGAHYWFPIFTCVEDTPAVLDSIEQLIGDIPDAEASAALAELRSRIDSPSDRDEWRASFEEASALRDRLLLSRIDFERLTFLKRKPFNSEQPFMDAHHLINPPGGGIYELSPVRPDGAVTPVVDSLGEGVYRDVHLHWDADKFLFAFGNGSDKWDGSQSYHIYEKQPGGGEPTQLTFGPKNDAEPFYLPNSQIGFTSDRSEHFVMCGGNRHSPVLHIMEGDGSDPRQLSFNVFNDFNPTVLPDGRILYSRWEYNERSVTSLHNPFTMKPDGTMVEPYYGNATFRPNVVMFPRPVPGTHKIMGLFTGHHGQTHGAVGVIDNYIGHDGNESLSVLTPNVPIIAEKIEDSRHGWFSDPAPLSEELYLCSYTPTVLPWLDRSWALYVGDRHGNLALVYRDPEISCAEPVPVITRVQPAALPPAPEDTDAQDAEAELLLLDVGVGLDGVDPSEAKYLRILEDIPRVGVTTGGVVITAGTQIYTIKRIIGIVPVEADGSARFTVPANRNVYFEVLDEDKLEIQRMRSVVCLKPGESRTCVGCHEPRHTAPVNRHVLASASPPSRPEPPSWGDKPFSYLRDVQPILNDRCVSCHTHDRFGNFVVLTDDLTDMFTIGYQELLPYLNVANSKRWDLPEDVFAQPAYTYGSKSSPLIQMLRDTHHDVQLSDDELLRLGTWVDANAVYYDTYETYHWGNRRIFPDATREKFRPIYQRRCAQCHGGGDGAHDTWWLSLNRRDAEHSRALMAPLAKAAGGWGRCEGTVFGDTSDVDYVALRDGLQSLADELAAHPRADIRSIADTPAATQVVTIPEPPPRASTLRPRLARDGCEPTAWSGSQACPAGRSAIPFRSTIATSPAIRSVSARGATARASARTRRRRSSTGSMGNTPSSSRPSAPLRSAARSSSRCSRTERASSIPA